jgi:ABC-type nitrate/sulfonate/bicarbonate transport system permease component
MGRTGMIITQVAFVAMLLLVWEFGVRAELFDSYLLGQPTLVAEYLTEWTLDGSLFQHMFATVFVTAVAYFGALLVGLAFGSLIGTVSWIERINRPFLAFWQGFPRLVFYPFFAVMLGYSISSRMLHVAFVIVFVIIVNTAAGIAATEQDVVHHARLLGASRWKILTDVKIPSAAGWVMASARVTFGLAIQAAMIAEFTGAQNGLGYLMVLGQNSFNVNIIWAAISIAVAVAFTIDLLIVRLQRHFDRWSVRTHR